MRKIKVWDQEYTYESYILYRLSQNHGSDSCATIAMLKDFCQERGIIYTGKEKKTDLIFLMLKSDVTCQEFEEKFGIGVDSKVYQEGFSITHTEVKRLEKKGYLAVIGRRRFRLYGKDQYAPLYSTSQYVAYTKEEIYALLNKKPVI